MKSIKIQDLSFSIGIKKIISDINLEIRSGEFFLLLGPSGCGKTTLLRLLAGFYRPDSGQLLFDDRVMNSIPPQDRNIGMVFQSYALFPHMNVSDNIEFGLKLRNIPKEKRYQIISNTLKLVRLEGYENRSPGSLSGGEQQRVAVARALAIQPELLLLDEPLSNLDAKLRIQMRQELRQIHQQTGVTTVYVTHDQEEALSMADRIAIMKDGQILQTGTPFDIYYHPVNSFIAGFIGEANILTGIVKEKLSNGRLMIQTPIGRLIADSGQINFNLNAVVTCCIRPESVLINHPSGTDTVNQFTGQIGDIQFRGDSIHLRLELPDSNILQSILHNPKLFHYQRNQAITITISPHDILLLKY